MSGLFKTVAARAAADADYVGDLAGEAGIYFEARISPSEIGRRLLALGEKEGTQVGPHQAEITYPDLSALPFSIRAAQDQIAATILKSREPSALEALNELFSFDIDTLAEQWHLLRQLEPTAAQLLMEGRLGSALQLLPARRWDEVGGKLGTGSPGVRDLLAQFILVWVANDLQIAAEAAHVKIYTPTGIPAIDGPDPTIAPLIDGVSKRIKEEVDLFDRAMKLVKSLRPGEKAGKKATLPFSNRGLDRQARSFLAQWLCEIRKDPTVSRADLERSIFAKLNRGRRAVRHISKVVAKARAKKPGSKTVTINQGKWLYSLQKPSPLDRLYLACWYTAGWIVPSSAAARWAENIVDALCDVSQAAAHPVFTLVHPPRAPMEGETVRSLFYIMRNAVVQDPTHLPKELGKLVVRGTGKEILVRSNHEVRRQTGSEVPFASIWQAFAKSSKYDSGQTSVANSLRMLLGSSEYREVVVEAQRVAQGTILRRLNDNKKPE